MNTLITDSFDDDPFWVSDSCINCGASYELHLEYPQVYFWRASSGMSGYWVSRESARDDNVPVSWYGSCTGYIGFYL